VVSDVFAELLGKDEAELRTETLQGLLLTSVRNRCINLLVHEQKTQQVQQAVRLEIQAAARDDGSVTMTEQLEAIRRFVNTQLPPISQQILRLRFQQGLKYREIAETIGMSEVTVHNHLSQSLKQMKNHFKSLGYGIE
jgi:RNA polymerase sigma-70 factor (ECF subfamily)